MSDAEEINQLHTEVAKATETILQKAIRIGELLAKRRKKLAHGQWMPRIKENLIFTGTRGGPGSDRRLHEY